jgi:hypothetical protein
MYGIDSDNLRLKLCSNEKFGLAPLAVLALAAVFAEETVASAKTADPKTKLEQSPGTHESLPKSLLEFPSITVGSNFMSVI